MSATIADPEPNQQLAMLRSSAFAFVAKESPFSRARALRGKPPGYDLRFWNALASQGWTGLLAPESAGGYAQGFAEMAAVAAALATKVAPEPVTPVLVFAGRLLQSCSDSATARQLLAEMAEGKTLPAVAWQEHTSGAADFDRDGGLSKPSTTCVRSGDRIVVRGSKRHIRPGAAASGYIVSAASADGLALVWVAAQSAALSKTIEPLADGTFAARLAFSDVELSAEMVLATGLQAEAALAAAYDEALVLTAVELQTLARCMLTMTLDYLRTRKQFGKLIGSFQSLQHRAVDMLIQQELGEAVVAQALTALDSGCPANERAALAARAKSRCSDAALQIGRESVQLHGAIGVTDENDLGLFLQRALVLSAWLGNGSTQRRRVAGLNRAAGADNGGLPS
ncbi:acyl-CoA dehydrogenase family protein [Piscinibacter sakaiensis]|uniref:acyl-CoA dehydrogenase family protein n=1 Tax=Piscinibacter sakaiensis TaxID=1547922 RepID=UPI003AAB684B